MCYVLSAEVMKVFNWMNSKLIWPLQALKKAKPRKHHLLWNNKCCCTKLVLVIKKSSVLVQDLAKWKYNMQKSNSAEHRKRKKERLERKLRMNVRINVEMRMLGFQQAYWQAIQNVFIQFKV